MQATMLCSQHVRPLPTGKAAPVQQLSSRSTLRPQLSVLSPRQSRVQRFTFGCRAVGNFETGTATPGLKPELRKALEDFIQQNKIVLFMKGTQQFPQCGFSNTCVQIFHALGVPPDQFTCVNILEDDSLRSGMKEFSQWPTFPQVYIDGEFFGGCDIMIESYTNGELQELVERVMNE